MSKDLDQTNKYNLITQETHYTEKKYLNMTQDGPVNRSIVLVTRLLAEV